MVAVRINGEESSIKADDLPKIADVIELIKTQIDPEHMITGIQFDGRDLEDGDWNSSPTKYQTAVLEVETGTPGEYVQNRLTLASKVVRSIYLAFRDARKCFQDGEMQDGNKKLVLAVNSFKAFIEWYGTLLELVPVQNRQSIDIGPEVNKLTEVCKRICQQQLYQSWWALGETLEKELEPGLDRLEDFCRKIGKEK